MATESPVVLDVRANLARGEEPFALIMATVSRLAPDESLLLIAPFEPIPLYKALAKQGYAYHTERGPQGEWRVTFSPDKDALARLDIPPMTQSVKALKASAQAQEPAGTRQIIELDNRGLEPPEPMMAILSHVPHLGPDDVLVAHNDHEPIFLYPRLDELGLIYEAAQQADGSFIVTIRRAP